jgi:hypothetical protein
MAIEIGEADAITDQSLSSSAARWWATLRIVA